MPPTSMNPWPDMLRSSVNAASVTPPKRRNGLSMPNNKAEPSQLDKFRDLAREPRDRESQRDSESE